MKRFLLLLLLPFFAQAQIGVNTTSPNAMLDVSSTNSGFLIPRIALTSALDATTVVNPQGGPLATSTLIYNTATAGASPDNVTPGFYYWNGTRWLGLGQTPDWQLNGNAGTNDPVSPAVYGTTPIAADENYIGTSDAQDVVFGANGRERMRIRQSDGRIGVGTASPASRFDVRETSNGGIAVFAVNESNGTSHGVGVFGLSTNAVGYGYGGLFNGGYMGINTQAMAGTHTGTAYGIYSTATGTTGTRIGGYFAATGGTDNYSIVTPETGGFAGFGTTAPLYRLHALQQTAGATTLYSENNSVAYSDGIGVFGRSVNNPGYGYGGRFEGGYHGIYAWANGGSYTGSTYGVYGNATGTAGTRIGGYFTASGGTNNLALQAAGRVRINDGTQGAGRVLTSDATGIASWQLPGANNIAGVIGSGINIPATQTSTYTYTGSYITLPPGRYAVQVVMLLAPLSAPGSVSPVNSSFWMRTTFTDTVGANVPSPDIIGSPLLSGNLAPSSSYGLVTGLIIINNATAGNKTYYYKAGHVVTHNTTYSVAAFGGGWNEDSIVAIRLN